MRNVSNRAWVGIGLIVLMVVVAGIFLFSMGTAPSKPTATVGSATATTASRPTQAVAVAAEALSTQQMAALPEATTFTKLNGPIDSSIEMSDGTVAHNATEIPVFVTPGGTAFAKLPPRQLSTDTWVPVVDRQPGWYQVLLPARPNGVMGWIESSKVTVANSPWLVRVRLTTRVVVVFKGNNEVGRWSAAIGASDTPTPTGRTFLLSDFTDPSQNYSPVIVALGIHSVALDTYGGGPGTVAIHTWPDKSVYGAAVSHGCVRVPSDALSVIRTIPLGTMVIITP